MSWIIDPLRANFHAHTKSWMGVTFGENSEEEMATAYAERGYDIVGISNYHRISTYLDSLRHSTFPSMSTDSIFSKVHNLPIGAKEGTNGPSYPVHFSLCIRPNKCL